MLINNKILQEVVDIIVKNQPIDNMIYSDKFSGYFMMLNQSVVTPENRYQIVLIPRDCSVPKAAELISTGYNSMKNYLQELGSQRLYLCKGDPIVVDIIDPQQRPNRKMTNNELDTHFQVIFSSCGKFLNLSPESLSTPLSFEQSLQLARDQLNNESS